MQNNFFESIPIGVLLILTILSILIPIQIGQRIGKKALKNERKFNDAPLGTVIGAALGLLAFMLAFTFQITTNRFDTRKELLLDEVANIRDTYLRASLLKEPQCSETKKLLLEYVDLRATLSDKAPNLPQLISRSEEIHSLLWKQAEALAELDRSSEVYALFTSSLNDLIDTHHKRVVVGLFYRIPSPILWVLYFITIFSMGILGFQFGISGRNNYFIQTTLALIFSVVMWLILSLDRPEKSVLKVNQQPMILLQKQLHQSIPGLN